MTNYEVLLIMGIAGIVGGTINFALYREERPDLLDWFWAVVLGLGASFLVPLFLNTISSSLLQGLLNGTAAVEDIYVFGGFCLLGAISSKALIQNLTRRVLSEARAARREVKSLKDEVAPIVAKETEPAEGKAKAGLTAIGYMVDGETKKVMNALASDKYSWRYLGGISQDTGLPSEQIQRSLGWLMANHLAVKSMGREGDIWGLTPEGRSLYFAFRESAK